MQAPIRPVVLARPFGVLHGHANSGEVRAKSTVLLEKWIVASVIDEECRRGFTRGNVLTGVHGGIAGTPADCVLTEDRTHEGPERWRVAASNGVHRCRIPCRRRVRRRP